MGPLGDYSPTSRPLSTMKVLHALVGYLTVTLTALPFHPFAFASPLAAIDANTTPNQSDSALDKRVPGDIIEARQLVFVIPAVAVVLAIVATVFVIVDFIEEDDVKRASFTQNVVSKSSLQYPSLNWVVCHSPHVAEFDGVEGTDWGYTHHELGITFARTIGYDLYWAKSGTFVRHGDGGYINWAYEGNVIQTNNDGAAVTFGIIII